MKKYISSYISSNLGISSHLATKIVEIDLNFVNFNLIQPDELLEIAKIYINKRNNKGK